MLRHLSSSRAASPVFKFAAGATELCEHEGEMAPPRKSRFPALPLAMKPMEVAERTEIPEAVSGA